jgi:DNA-binding CsgD family transcriptional regulator
VEAHLAHVYAKLDVNSRRSLGAALATGDRV